MTACAVVPDPAKKSSTRASGLSTEPARTSSTAYSDFGNGKRGTDELLEEASRTHPPCHSGGSVRGSASRVAGPTASSASRLRPTPGHPDFPFSIRCEPGPEVVQRSGPVVRPHEHGPPRATHAFRRERHRPRPRCHRPDGEPLRWHQSRLAPTSGIGSPTRQRHGPGSMKTG